MYSYSRFITSLLLALVVLTHHSLVAQHQHELDSLLRILNDTRIDTIQLKANRQMGQWYEGNNNNKAIEYYEKARKISEKLNRTLDLADNNYSLGYGYLNKGNLDLSLGYYLRAVELYEQINFEPSLPDAYLSIITVYNELGDFDKAKKYIQKSEESLARMKDTFHLCSFYAQVGTVYSRNGFQDSAYQNLQKGLQLAKMSGDIQSQVVCFSNLSLVYKKTKQYAIALRYCDSVDQLLPLLEENQIDLAMNHNNKACIYAELKNHVAAELNFTQSIKYALEAGHVGVELENYRNLADMYKAMGSYKNYATYLTKYTQLKDSLFTSDTKNQITQLEADYEVGQKNNELLAKDVFIQQQKNQRNIAWVISLSTLLLLGGAVYLNRILSNKKKLLEEKNELIEEQKTNLVNLNQVKDRLFSVISHDLRNPLNTLQTYLMLSDNESISADKRLLFKKESIQAVAHTGNLLDNLLTWASMQLKNTAPTIVPLVLQDVVQDVLHVLIPQAKQKNIEIEVSLDKSVVLSDADILAIALRNIITNAIKFSKEGGRIFIEGQTIANNYTLHIQDYGIGMTEEQIENILQSKNRNTQQGTQGESGHGLGLFLVLQLLQKVDVPLQIKSTPEKGSLFTLTFERYA